MKPHLISFKLCPYVQKAVLTLLSKGIDYEIEYIDLENPPAWFRELSPLGKVPVLKVGDEVLFESSVIVEYLDEVYGTSLHPSDALSKAQNRSWMEFGNECLMNVFNLIIQPEQQGFIEQREALRNKLDRLEKRLTGSSFFNGENVSLVDLSFTPFFQRLQYINEVSPGLLDPEHHPKLVHWSNKLLTQPIVSASTVAEIKQLYTGMMKKRSGYLSTLMT
ncbi:MAG: glutathione S-transferase family protein [Gammaproteobacteria bacterium]|nr:glutathione S-transferase family protein [Gammaproteobacteria bacterium]MBL6998500.1 glutathione S-transferase family protein [Gammaproteobacteria bacterium]